MHGYVDSQGCQIYYQVRGGGPPLILLMGFGADGAVWEQHAAVYEQHFQCIILDNRGVGQSDQPAGPYSTEMMAADTIAVMDQLNVATAQVAGISMGGAIAQSIAIQYPDRVSSLCLISTWPVFNQYAISVYENLKKIRRVAAPDVFMELLQLWIFAPPYYESDYQSLIEGQQAALATQTPQTTAGFDGQLDACIHHNTVDRLHEIQVPTLITIGMMDVFTPPAFSHILHDKIAGSIIERFPDGGHVHHWEDLDRFNRITLDFLKRHQA